MLSATKRDIDVLLDLAAYELEAAIQHRLRSTDDFVGTKRSLDACH